MTDEQLTDEQRDEAESTEADEQSASVAAEQVSDDSNAPASASAEAPADELGATRKERDEYLELAQRTRADFDNYRKRVAKDATDALRRGKLDLAKELIPVIDNLERAIAAGEASSDPAGLAKGVGLVHSELRSALGRVGLESYDPSGEQFDPNLHEAISTRAQEGVAPGTVVETIEPGYRLSDQVLRAARVVVSE